MTFTEACDVVEQIRSLERVEFVLRTAVSRDWQPVRTAIADRVRLLHYAVEQEDPVLIAAVVLALERQVELSSAVQPPLPSLATDGRIH
jgi:hypothetical protein